MKAARWSLRRAALDPCAPALLLVPAVIVLALLSEPLRAVVYLGAAVPLFLFGAWRLADPIAAGIGAAVGALFVPDPASAVAVAALVALVAAVRVTGTPLFYLLALPAPWLAPLAGGWVAGAALALAAAETGRAGSNPFDRFTPWAALLLGAGLSLVLQTTLPFLGAIVGAMVRVLGAHPARARWGAGMARLAPLFAAGPAAVGFVLAALVRAPEASDLSVVLQAWGLVGLGALFALSVVGLPILLAADGPDGATVLALWAFGAVAPLVLLVQGHLLAATAVGGLAWIGIGYAVAVGTRRSAASGGRAGRAAAVAVALSAVLAWTLTQTVGP